MASLTWHHAEEGISQGYIQKGEYVLQRCLQTCIMKFSKDKRLQSHKYHIIEEYFITWTGVYDK